MSSTTNDHSKTNKNLLSKFFGNKVNLAPASSAAADDSASSTMSGATLRQEQQSKPASTEEQASFSDLMAKANTMPPDEFKAYMARYKEEVDSGQRKQHWGRHWEYSKDFVNNEPL